MVPYSDPGGRQIPNPLTLKKVMPHAQKLDVDWAVNNYDRIRNEWRKKFE